MIVSLDCVDSSQLFDHFIQLLRGMRSQRTPLVSILVLLLDAFGVEWIGGDLRIRVFLFFHIVYNRVVIES